MMAVKRKDFNLNSFKEKEKKPLIAVTMASSRQGQSVVKMLSKSGKFKIRAITRNPKSLNSLKLSNLPNVEIVQGDLLDKNSLRKCFKNVYGIFGNTTPTTGWKIWKGSMNKEYELAQGRNLIDIVKEVEAKGKLKHFVFSSICKGKDPLKGIEIPAHFSTKWSLEEYINIKNLSPLTTILRPASYFENFDIDIPGLGLYSNNFIGIVKPDTPWQILSVEDIGKWANAAFLHPYKFLNRQFNIASEELTGKEMALKIQQLQTNRARTNYIMIPRTLMYLIEHDIATMANWIDKIGYGANLNTLNNVSNELSINMMPFSKWIEIKLGRQETKQTYIYT